MQPIIKLQDTQPYRQYKEIILATTSIYGAMFIIPQLMLDTPLGFSILHKGYGTDEVTGEPIDLGYYSYNEYMALAGNKAFYVNSTVVTGVDEEGNDITEPTHALLSENITSSYIRDDINAQLVGSPFTLHDGKDMSEWQDLDQTYYIWCITTDKRMPFCFDEFKKVSPLFNVPEEVVV